MTDFKMTKNGLRDQQHLLQQLEKYLPTLQLKKSLLQSQLVTVKNRIEKLFEEYSSKKQKSMEFGMLLTDELDLDPLNYINIKFIEKIYENIAGVEIPVFNNVIFDDKPYNLFDSPFWFDEAIHMLKSMIISREKMNVETEKKLALEKEYREVSIRVNLFEKILIPRTLTNIKKIKIFLGDQMLAAVSQAKVAKLKKADKSDY